MPSRVSGEGGIRTPDTGLTPYNGLANRPFANATSANPSTSDEGQLRVSPSVSLTLEKHPDLAALVEAWPTLPEAVRASVFAVLKGGVR